jgi:hypothetical protein
MTTRYQRGNQNRKSKDRQYNDHKIPLVSCSPCIVCPSIYDSGYPFGILWSLYCLSFDLRFWLPLWYLVVIVLSVLRFTILVTLLVSCGHCIVCPVIYDSGYPFGILWSLWCLSFDLRFRLPSWSRYQRGNQNRKSQNRQHNDHKIPKG